MRCAIIDKIMFALEVSGSCTGYFFSPEDENADDKHAGHTDDMES
jgi:hypothetical protein